MPADRVVDVQFRAFMADPFATIHEIYDRLGLELGADAEQRMRAFLADNTTEKHGGHHYTFADTGLDDGEWRERTRSYQEYFDVRVRETSGLRSRRSGRSRRYPAGVTITGTGEAWPALAVRGLAKAFGPKIAVAEINLDVPRGSFFGIVGPNGAGKTTTLRMATGLLRPDRGQVWVDGIDVWTDPIAAKARIGVLPEDLALFERLRGRELLEFHGLLRNMPTDVIASRAGELLDLLGLADAADTLVDRLQPRHAQEARARRGAAARPAPAVPRRAVRGDRSGVGARDPIGARALHRAAAARSCSRAT